MKHLIFFGILVCWLGLTVPARPGTPDEGSLRAAAAAFSLTTSVDGAGWQAYGSFLHADFTRWFVGKRVFDRDGLIASVREWWQDGTRVASTESEIVHLSISGNLGVVRKNVTERYLDGKGKASGEFRGFAVQVWQYRDNRWQMLTLDIAPVQTP